VRTLTWQIALPSKPQTDPEPRAKQRQVRGLAVADYQAVLSAVVTLAGLLRLGLAALQGVGARGRLVRILLGRNASQSLPVRFDGGVVE